MIFSEHVELIQPKLTDAYVANSVSKLRQQQQKMQLQMKFLQAFPTPQILIYINVWASKT